MVASNPNPVSRPDHKLPCLLRSRPSQSDLLSSYGVVAFARFAARSDSTGWMGLIVPVVGRCLPGWAGMLAPELLHRSYVLLPLTQDNNLVPVGSYTEFHRGKGCMSWPVSAAFTPQPPISLRYEPTFVLTRQRRSPSGGG